MTPITSEEAHDILPLLDRAVLRTVCWEKQEKKQLETSISFCRTDQNCQQERKVRSYAFLNITGTLPHQQAIFIRLRVKFLELTSN